jgi:hypothetical protein
MQDNHFGFTLRQACRLLGISYEAGRAQLRRSGKLRGVNAVKRSDGRWLLPRAEVLRLAGTPAAGPRAVIDIRATNPWLEELGLLIDDPMAERIAIALNDPRDDTDQFPQCRLDEWYAVRGWIAAARRRLNAARPRLTPEQWTNAQRLMALAVAPIVADLDPAALQQAVVDWIGGAV